MGPSPRSQFEFWQLRSRPRSRKRSAMRNLPEILRRGINENSRT
jgi:hypothetical protein